jgi:lipopolysaccharide/colanic/teichoic acid biosynthesis glycosyltransferase
MELGVSPRDAMKRAFDIVVSLTALVALAPVMVIIAPLVRLDSAGPILFRQVRPGRGMVPFVILKFRTMTVGSDLVDPEKLNDMGVGPMHKQGRDARITRIGAVLRRFSLDELPQLINVLKGDMSLVGPRPLLGWEMPENDMKARSAVKPGITGLWQVSGRSNLSFEQMLALDLEYVRNRSLRLDIDILLRTLPAVIRSVGAY